MTGKVRTISAHVPTTFFFGPTGKLMSAQFIASLFDTDRPEFFLQTKRSRWKWSVPETRSEALNRLTKLVQQEALRDISRSSSKG